MTTYLVVLFRFVEELPPKCNIGGLFEDFFQCAKVVRPDCRDRRAGMMSYALSTAHHFDMDESEVKG